VLLTSRRGALILLALLVGSAGGARTAGVQAREAPTLNELIERADYLVRGRVVAVRHEPGKRFVVFENAEIVRPHAEPEFVDNYTIRQAPWALGVGDGQHVAWLMRRHGSYEAVDGDGGYFNVLEKDGSLSVRNLRHNVGLWADRFFLDPGLRADVKSHLPPDSQHLVNIGDRALEEGEPIPWEFLKAAVMAKFNRRSALR
jgi:hypothetical protein